MKAVCDDVLKRVKGGGPLPPELDTVAPALKKAFERRRKLIVE